MDGSCFAVFKTVCERLFGWIAVIIVAEVDSEFMLLRRRTDDAIIEDNCQQTSDVIHTLTSVLDEDRTRTRTRTRVHTSTRRPHYHKPISSTSTSTIVLHRPYHPISLFILTPPLPSQHTLAITIVHLISRPEAAPPLARPTAPPYQLRSTSNGSRIILVGAILGII